MSNFYFNGTPARQADPDLDAKRAAFQALPAEQQAAVLAHYQKTLAAAAAVRAHLAQQHAVRAIRAAQSGIGNT